jgi:septal ring factor EnvC (AmiA/AmiB activator)
VLAVSSTHQPISLIHDTSKNFIRSVDVLVTEADKDLTKATKNQDALQAELARLAEEFKQRAIELERTKLELQNSKRQCELVKSLLADATAEKDIMYEVSEDMKFP